MLRVTSSSMLASMFEAVACVAATVLATAADISVIAVICSVCCEDVKVASASEIAWVRACVVVVR